MPYTYTLYVANVHSALNMSDVLIKACIKVNEATILPQS